MPFNRGTTHEDDPDVQCLGKRKPRWQLMSWFVLLLITQLSVVQADATAPCNVGSGAISTECGVNASATGAGATAIGTNAIASATNSTALGLSAQATDTNATAVGRLAVASENYASALGNSAIATAALSSAIGGDSQARSANATSVGYAAGYSGATAVTDSPGAIAVGYFASINPASPGAIAIGSTDDAPGISTRGAEATGENAIAIGLEAKANQAGAIALGAHTVANKAHTMTVGVPVEVRRDDGTAQVLVNEKSAGNMVRTLFNVVCDTCTPGFRFNQLLPSNNTWNFRMLQSGAFSVDDPATMGKEAEFRSGGDLKIAGTLIQSSSRSLKTGIVALESEEVLAKIARLPISQWSYKKDDGRIKHIGPMAEDFHALFKVGTDNRSISSLDTSGVALAAIKALKKENDESRMKDRELVQRLQEKDTQIARLQNQIDELREMLTGMLVRNQSGQTAGRL